MEGELPRRQQGVARRSPPTYYSSILQSASEQGDVGQCRRAPPNEKLLRYLTCTDSAPKLLNMATLVPCRKAPSPISVSEWATQSVGAGSAPRSLTAQPCLGARPMEAGSRR